MSQRRFKSKTSEEPTEGRPSANHTRFAWWVTRYRARRRRLAHPEYPVQDPKMPTVYPSERHLAALGAELVTRR
jgi:hypothetical protein